MAELDFASIIDIGSLVVETIIVVLLVKTVRDYAEVAKMSRLQVKQRFRPWIGPTTGIELLREVDNKYQFSVTIKNFGEIPATNVIAASTTRHDMPNRNMISDVTKEAANDSTESLTKFVLGPLLPNMEKRYWLFIDSQTMQRAKAGESHLFTMINFSYEFEGGRSSYGMISQFDPKSNIFVHKDMWVGSD